VRQTILLNSNGKVISFIDNSEITSTPMEEKFENKPFSTTKAPTRKNEQKVFTENDLMDPKFTCIPEESFMVDCNTCWCAKNSKSPRYCTRIACKPKRYPSLEQQMKDAENISQNHHK
jgi:hypothetical protein